MPLPSVTGLPRFAGFRFSGHNRGRRPVLADNTARPPSKGTDMSEQKPTIVLVHGAFAESSSWNGVIAQLQQHDVTAVAVANPLRSLAGDAAYVRDVLASIEGPIVLVGHSYGGLVITEAAAGNEAVVGLVYVAAFVPETGQSAFELSNSAPGGTLGDALT